MTRTRRTSLIAAAVAAIVTAANASQGAYFSQSWGWVALAFLVPTTVLLILDRVDAPGRARAAFAALVVALAAWIALSSLWSISTPASIREVERALVYVAVALAIALVLRRGDGPGVLAGVVLGVALICSYALATRLFPDRLDTYDDPITEYRLAAPLGYWNALGLLASMGVLASLGFAAHARRVAGALAAAAAIPVATATLYFTYSRGAWAALVIGFVFAVAVDPRRLRLVWISLVVAVPAGLCIAYGSGLDALTTEGAVPRAAAREGHKMAIAVALAVVASVVGAWSARAVARRVRASRSVRRRFDVTLASVVGLVVVVGLVAAGGPAAVVDGVQKRFDADPVGSVDLNDRLFSVSGNGRSEQLRVAWNAGLEHPILGNGSGTFEYLWYEHRPSVLVVRDGHSLYMETFAELGVVGLSFLIGFLVVLVWNGVRARRNRLVSAGTSAVVAWSAAAMFDWHWEMVGVTVTALLAGAAGVLAIERGAPRELRRSVRGALVAGAVVASVLAVWSLVGNQALFAGRDALERRDWAMARDDGRRAHDLLFWSAEPDLVRGDAAAGLGDREGALRAYRDATATDPRSWVAWLRLAQVARGDERTTAYERVRELNPREEGLPGE